MDFNILCLLCFIYIKTVESAKIYVIDVKEPKPTFDTDDELSYNPNKKAKDNVNMNIVMCQRLFGSIYSNRDQHMRCLKALQKRKDEIEVIDIRDPIKTQHQSYKAHPKGYHMYGRQQYKPIVDLSKFSQDYLDVNDLARSDFASDYVDVGDLRGKRSVIAECKNQIDEFGQMTHKCSPDARKNLVISTFRSDLIENIDKLLRMKKNKRYKVVSKETDESNDSNTEAVSNSESIENDLSVEVTTKRPKKKRKGSKDYMYLQGNKVYEESDFRRNKEKIRDRKEISGDSIRNKSDNLKTNFRRGLRMPHFLPKRLHWEEEDFHNLGYYWFNGPRGKFKNWKTR